MPNLDRPLSPHLLIYKPQLTSILSITHRFTGVGLALGSILVAGWLFAALAGVHAFSLTVIFRENILGQIMLFCWLFAFLYHLLNGIRHLKWDAGYGLSLPSVYRSGYVVIIGAVVLSVLIWTKTGVSP